MLSLGMMTTNNHHCGMDNDSMNGVRSLVDGAAAAADDVGVRGR